jgi:hypothetical protein
VVANIRSGSSPGGALHYNKEKVDKDEAEVLYWQKMLEPFDIHGRMDVDACMESFMPYLEANKRTNNTVFHVSLNPSPEDKLAVTRARKIQRFLSQPFHVAEVFTGSPGKYVPLKETIRGFKMIVDGECDQLPEQAFYMVGTIDEAFEKAKTIK